MSKYRVIFETSARSDLKRLPRLQVERILTRISALVDNPRPPGVKKIAGSENGWRIRVGAYRVVYEIEDDECLVKVMRIKRRSIAYR
jgi:mRNA interferase RelE/StbE